jgi:hypothetical protein
MGRRRRRRSCSSDLHLHLLFFLCLRWVFPTGWYGLVGRVRSDDDACPLVRFLVWTRSVGDLDDETGRLIWRESAQREEGG